MTGNGLLRLQVFDVNAILHPGQELVTSVGRGTAQPGVPVGVITKLEGTSSSLTKEALVRPFADDTALGVVGVVIVPPRTDPRFSVLPPRPTHPRLLQRPPRRAVTARLLAPPPRRPPDRGADVRRAALAAALLLLAILIQITLVNNLPWPGAAGPDLVLVVVVALALTGGRWKACWPVSALVSPWTWRRRHPTDWPVRAGVLPGRIRLRPGRQPPERVRLGADRRGGHRVGRRGAALRSDRYALRRPQRHLVRSRSRAARLRAVRRAAQPLRATP